MVPGPMSDLHSTNSEAGKPEMYVHIHARDNHRKLIPFQCQDQFMTFLVGFCSNWGIFDLGSTGTKSEGVWEPGKKLIIPLYALSSI